jgi:hypothetical protein
MARTLLATLDYPSVYPSVYIWVERRAHVKSDARHLEEIAPHIAHEDRVTVADDESGEPMKANDAVEEGPGDGHGGGRVAKGDEVCVLGETVNDGEDD